MLKSLLSKSLKTLADNVDSGNCNMSEEEMQNTIDQIQELLENNNRMSKYQACEYLNMSRASFDKLVLLGLIPKGTHTPGFKEISWSKKELDRIKDKFK